MKLNQRLLLLSIYSAVLLLFSCQEQIPKADLILVNATIWTGNDLQLEAQSMAVLADTIFVIGSNEGLVQYKGIRPEYDRTLIHIKLLS